MTIETERLRLRPWALADAEALFCCARDPRIGAGAGWAAHPDVDHSRRIIREVLSQPDTFAVESKEFSYPVGSIGLMRGGRSCLDLPDDEGEIGYWLGAPFWGRGLMREAVRGLMAYAFGELALAKLWGVCSEANARSRRVLESCGFHALSPDAVPDRLRAARKRVAAITAADFFSVFGRR